MKEKTTQKGKESNKTSEQAPNSKQSCMLYGFLFDFKV